MTNPVPPALRTWFVVHFVADVLFAIPLMFAPTFTLQLLGWEMIDPLMTRVVAAALFGIGIESWLGRNAGLEAFRGMLTLKVIWSAAVVLGGGASLVMGVQGAPPMAWALIGVFLIFNVAWVYWLLRVRALSV